MVIYSVRELSRVACFVKLAQYGTKTRGTRLALCYDSFQRVISPQVSQLDKSISRGQKPIITLTVTYGYTHIRILPQLLF